MSSFPSGTVTMVFSDVEGSTLLLSRLGPAYGDALDGQRRVLRQAWAAFGGMELGTEGDSFFVVFPAAPDAVAAAVQGQRGLAGFPWPSGERVRVRMGIHTGSPTLHDGGYVGMDVHRAARVATAAHGGQLVITDATRQLVGDRLPDGAWTVDLGWHRLKDLVAPEHLFQVAGVGSQESFPPLRSLGTVSNLPEDPTSLVGRDEVMAELGVLLRSEAVRLITLTGPGGSGKTRLATAAARELASHFSDGVYFVPLSAVTEAEVMWKVIAESVGVNGSRGPEDLVERLRYRRLLLVLDNLEQLAGADMVVADLVADAPQVVILATSRRPLHLRSEHEFPVPPLSLPDRSGLVAADRSGAVRMFVQHAQMVRPNFTLSDANVEHVSAVCRRLDGLPLAVELAASRTKLLSPAALLTRLESTLGLRSGGADRPARQQTLRDTIAWSYQLLTPELQGAFRQLGVFAGGADLDAVQAIATRGSDPLDNIADLVDAALATVADDSDGQPRIGLLQTVRDFALDQLAQAGELEDARGRHAVHYAKCVDTWAPRLHTGLDLSARVQLERDFENILEALNWTLRPGAATPPPREQGDIGLQLAVQLREFWTLPQHRSQGKRWLGRAVELTGGQDSSTLAAALLGLFKFDEAPSEENARQALEMCRRLGDRKGTAEALHELEWFYRDDLDTAKRLLDESAALARQAGDNMRLSWVLARSADGAMRRHQPERALDLLREAADLARQRGDERTAVSAQLDMTDPLIALDRADAARTNLDDHVADVLRVRDGALDIDITAYYAIVFSALRDDELAGRMVGANWARHAVYSNLNLDEEESWLQRTGIAQSRSRLGEARWEQAIQTGLGYTMEEALHDARGFQEPHA